MKFGKVISISVVAVLLSTAAYAGPGGKSRGHFGGGNGVRSHDSSHPRAVKRARDAIAGQSSDDNGGVDDNGNDSADDNGNDSADDSRDDNGDDSSETEGGESEGEAPSSPPPSC